MQKENRKSRDSSLNKMCRTCLSEKGNLRELFPSRLPLMIEACASVEVSKNDDLPKYVCKKCVQQISRFYSFKKKIERCNRILQNNVKRNQMKEKKFADILCEAVNDAEIEVGSEEIIRNCPQITADKMVIKDVPLLNQMQLNFIQIDKVRNDSKEVRQVVEEIIDKSSDNEQLLAPIFTDGPPPLIPIMDAKVIDDPSEAAATPKSLPEDAPPLIPIKPGTISDPFGVATASDDANNPPRDLKLSCTVCSEEFSSVLALKQHKKFNCQFNGLQCNICRKDFKERSRLIGHLKGHMIAKDYACKICDKRYPNPSTFRVHMRTHTGERPFQCQICHKGFVRWSGVIGHMKTHNSDKPFKCDECGKSFKIASNLERHKVLHAGILPYCCNFCGKTFSQADNLRLHIRTYHTNERPYLCNECGKGFVSSTRLNRHMWVHTGYKPYKCERCSKAYSNSNDLKNHERTQHDGANGDTEKPYACQHCDLRFFHSCRLSKHAKTHNRPYSCGECSKTFNSENVFNKHVNNKHGGSCEERGKPKTDTFVEYQ